MVEPTVVHLATMLAVKPEKPVVGNGVGELHRRKSDPAK
jgi:hypothetical protein